MSKPRRSERGQRLAGEAITDTGLAARTKIIKDEIYMMAKYCLIFIFVEIDSRYWQLSDCWTGNTRIFAPIYLLELLA